MNGREMLEAMSHIDEGYVADAAAVPAGRRRFRPMLAAAACLAVVLLAGAWRLNLKSASREETVYDEAAPMVLGTQRAVSMEAAPGEMTVRVLSREGNALRCTVTQPGTSGYEVGAQILALLPENAPEPEATDKDSTTDAEVQEKENGKQSAAQGIIAAAAPLSPAGEAPTGQELTLTFLHTQEDSTVTVLSYLPTAP